VTLAETNTIAKRLGLPQDAVRKLQRYGLLRRLDLDEHELRRRLWRGHLAHLREAGSAQDNHLERTDTGTNPPRLRT
jgi:hypothetical protein